MTYILKNKNLELHIDEPLENYNFSRFDWTGKIVKVKFQNVQVSGVESTDCKDETAFGKGFYNEFGIDDAMGFEEAEIGGWFHKIGIGLLKKEDNEYLFHKKYEIKPAAFEIIAESNKLVISCNSEVVNGYSYFLKKEIVLTNNSFSINYYLKNTGKKDIITNEYVHNFTAINNKVIGPDYSLKFPFLLKPERFEETVNPEQKVIVGCKEINFKAAPDEQFFFSNLSGSEMVNAGWELINNKSKIGISETGNFHTNKVNLWGWKDVISPELFFDISLKPGQYTQWTRNYNMYKI